MSSESNYIGPIRIMPYVHCRPGVIRSSSTGLKIEMFHSSLFLTDPIKSIYYQERLSCPSPLVCKSCFQRGSWISPLFGPLGPFVWEGGKHRAQCVEGQGSPVFCTLLFNTIFFFFNESSYSPQKKEVFHYLRLFSFFP